MRSTYQHIVLNICEESFLKSLSHARDTEQSRNKIRIHVCLTLNCDIDLVLTMLNHALYTLVIMPKACPKLFLNPPRHLRDIGHKKQTTFDFDL